ncbi:C40 family peptidase [Lentzea jiangxiensis]|uniref:Cell wall-associated hydrolase, NlpC family n=1 Tax=Lentzea jiangxiensis TaxID=641025 RepID=A0A1H0X4I8_9PSEU|nr:NlpC/P60 family protein [Lentzea jiangxiensis]SDP97851.1 Cell wall-associated hydrolase, NlpC family [Lentzea jiangxiensis]
MIKTLLVPIAALAAALLLVLMVLQPQRADADTITPPVTCQVPAPGADPSSAPPSDGAFHGVRLSPVQTDTAQKVLGVAKHMSITRRGAVIGIQAGMQESTLNPLARNGNAVGVFQQIAPGPWNAYSGYDRTDAAAAAKGFFSVLLKRAPGYETDPRSNHELAEEVERSGEGWRYQRHQPFAEAVVAALYDGSGPLLDCADRSFKGRIQVTVQGSDVTLPAEAGVAGVVRASSPQVAAAIAAGLSWLGITYSWGGGDANGPTKGIRDGGVADAHGDYDKVGFDCSGLTLYAYAQAGVQIIRPSDAQLTRTRLVVPFTQARAGDLLFWGTHHVAMYLGQLGGRHLMLEAPQSGEVVRVSTVRTGGDFRNVAARPIP